MMTADEALYRQLILRILLLQIQGFALGWKKLFRFAASSVAMVPLFIGYTLFLVVGAATFQTSPFSWFLLLYVLVLAAPLIIALIFICGADLPSALLWVAWGINFLPAAFLVYALFFFKIQF